MRVDEIECFERLHPFQIWGVFHCSIGFRFCGFEFISAAVFEMPDENGATVGASLDMMQKYVFVLRMQMFRKFIMKVPKQDKIL
jgi:hypothetical protein